MPPARAQAPSEAPRCQAFRPTREQREPGIAGARPERVRASGVHPSWPTPWARVAGRLSAAAALTLTILAASTAVAFPGQAVRLGGVEAQGPASRSITALHHNPAMLAGLGGTGVHMSASTGLDQRWVRRAQDMGLGPRISLINPTVEYFVGGNLSLDPVALGVGLYTLGNEFHLNSANTLRYHLAPELDVPPLLCDGTTDSCPLNGGASTIRTDLSFALAWNVLSTLKIGATLHLPRLRMRFAYDNSTELGQNTESGAPQCSTVEDPNCAERLGFRGVTRWLPGTSTRPSGIDLVLTLGVAYDVTRRVTLGVRFRTRPLLNGGEIAVAGAGLTCSPTDDEDSPASVPRCSVAPTVDAFVTQRMPREAAFGAAFVLGRSKQWHLDSNLYWIDLCTDVLGEGSGIRSCANPGLQRINLINRDPGSSLLPETIRYRGYQDIFGLDLFTTYQMRSNIALTFAGHTSSPAVRRSAMSPGNGDGWRVGLSFGAILRIRHSNFQLIPGYGVDLFPPTTVDDAAFDPDAGEQFLNALSDLNSGVAETVLEGRARPSNAGRYTGMVHTFSLALRWAERGLGVDR